jgi:hypothetical protein
MREDGRWQWSADSITVRWQAVAKQLSCVREASD